MTLQELEKKLNINAEKFDGSPEMINKYDIGVHQMDEQAWFDLFTVDGAMEIEKGDWIISYEDNYWYIPDIIFRHILGTTD